MQSGDQVAQIRHHSGAVWPVFECDLARPLCRDDEWRGSQLFDAIGKYRWPATDDILVHNPFRR